MLPSQHIRHFINAFYWSVSGLRATFHDEIAFRQILYWSVAAILLVIWLADSWLETILLLLPPFICVIVELLNTAIENIVDLAQPEWHELAKKAKDAGSAAQFVAQLFNISVWGSWLICKIIL